MFFRLNFTSVRRLSIEWPTKGWFSLVVNDFLSLVSGVATYECDLKLTASHAGNSADVFIPLANFLYLQKLLSQREREAQFVAYSCSSRIISISTAAKSFGIVCLC